MTTAEVHDKKWECSDICIPPPNPIYCYIICVVVNTLVMWYSGSSQNQQNQSEAIGLPQEEAGRGSISIGGHVANHFTIAAPQQEERDVYKDIHTSISRPYYLAAPGMETVYVILTFMSACIMAKCSCCN